MKIRMGPYPEWQGTKYLKIANFHWHSLCDKHYSKHLTFMKSFNPMRSVTIIVPMRPREKYIFHCHTTSVEKARNMNPGILAAEPMYIATILFCLKGIGPTYPSWVFLPERGESIPCLHSRCFLVGQVFSIFYLLLTLSGPKWWYVRVCPFCLVFCFPFPSNMKLAALQSSGNLHPFGKNQLYTYISPQQSYLWNLHRVLAGSAQVPLCPLKETRKYIFLFLSPYIFSALSALGTSLNGLLPFQLWSLPTEQK